MMQVVDYLPYGRQIYHIINNMAADDLATQGARSPAAMIYTYDLYIHSATHP